MTPGEILELKIKIVTAILTGIAASEAGSNFIMLDHGKYGDMIAKAATEMATKVVNQIIAEI